MAIDGLIPRKTLFGNPDKASPQISPNGEYITFLAPVNGVLNIWLAKSTDPHSAIPITEDSDRGIRFYGWTYTNEHIAYIQDIGGDENWHVYVVNINNHETKDLTPYDGVQARFQEISPKFPNDLLLALNDRDPQLHDVYKVNLDTGDRTLVQQNDGFAGYITDDNFDVRFATRVTEDGGSELLQKEEDSTWKSFIQIGIEDTLTTSPIGFDNTGGILYLVDSRNRDTAALISLNLTTGETNLIAENPHADVSDTMVDPNNKNIQAVAFTHERKTWIFLDDHVKKDLAYLESVCQGEIEIVSQSFDDGIWIVAFVLDNGPVRFYTYNRLNQQATFLFTNRDSLDSLNLSSMHSTTIKSRDNFDLVSYYTLPASHGNQTEIPEAPCPMVLLVHGGPWHRDTWGYSALHQLLSNRGYAVLSVNFRGSTGFGKAFINAANLEWGRNMHNDLLDAVKWAIDKRIADPDKIAIMGGSYGGYATLIGLTATPGIFACGIDIVGPSNLLTLINSIPPYWQPQIELWASRVGDHRTEEGRNLLSERSPLNYINNISEPLLIGQGANDPRVNQAESDQIVNAMIEKGIPVTYVLYPDEGHGFVRPDNNLSFFAVAEAFLSTHLNGNYEPINDDFKGASVTVPVGASEVPGLSEAL
ncbi:MAG: S9 family peptidase [Dehalococcoidia bacterium]|nr:S9 family peptidase [Dehalococcoidia bacterium]